MEDLREQHEAATAPISEDQQARALSAQSSDAELLEAPRSVIVKTLAIHKIDHNTLNISRSKFDKLNKAELIKALRAKDSAPKAESVEAKDTQNIDFIGAAINIKKHAEKARKSGDYSALDGVVADTLLTVANNDASLSNLPIKSEHLSKVVIGAGVLYFGARLIGFDNIKKYLKIKPKEKPIETAGENE